MNIISIFNLTVFHHLSHFFHFFVGEFGAVFEVYLFAFFGQLAGHLDAICELEVVKNGMFLVKQGVLLCVPSVRDVMMRLQSTKLGLMHHICMLILPPYQHMIIFLLVIIELLTQISYFLFLG